MSDGSHDIPFGELPPVLPIFPLSGALLLPRGRLPLNIFEPRYLKLIEDVLGADRLIGMVQPTRSEHESEAPPLFGMGCAGRINAFAETDQRRYLITLAGVCRFRIAEELSVTTPYRQVRPEWSPFEGDCERDADPMIDRERLVTSLRAYLGVQGIQIEWETLEELDNEALVTSLAMACPFDPTEKQAMLEAESVEERGRALTALLEMGAIAGDADGAPTH